MMGDDGNEQEEGLGDTERTGNAIQKKLQSWSTIGTEQTSCFDQTTSRKLQLVKGYN